MTASAGAAGRAGGVGNPPPLPVGVPLGGDGGEQAQPPPPLQPLSQIMHARPTYSRNATRSIGTVCFTQPIRWKNSWKVARSWMRGLTLGSMYSATSRIAARAPLSLRAPKAWVAGP